MEFLDFSGLQTFYNKLKSKFVSTINGSTPDANGSINITPAMIGAMPINGTGSSVIYSLDTFWSGVGYYNGAMIIAAGTPNSQGIQLRLSNGSFSYRNYTTSGWSTWKVISSSSGGGSVIPY